MVFLERHSKEQVIFSFINNMKQLLAVFILIPSRSVFQIYMGSDVNIQKQ